MKTEQSSIMIMSFASESLKLYADWLDLCQAYVKFLQDCMSFYEGVAIK